MCLRVVLHLHPGLLPRPAVWESGIRDLSSSFCRCLVPTNLFDKFRIIVLCNQKRGSVPTISPKSTATLISKQQ